MIAARASHELRDYPARDAALRRVEADAPQEVALRAIAQGEMLLAERRPQEALAALAVLGERHTAALRLELRAHRELRHWDEVLRLTAELEKRGVFDAEQAAQLRRAALVENLKRKALDAHALEEYWDRLPVADRRDPKVALAAAQCFAALGGCGRAHAAIEASLEREWDPELAAAYGDCLGGDALAQLERAERWLAAHPRDANLLLTLGRLCAHQQLWGKAQNYLEASIAVEATYTAHLALAELHDRLGATDAARRHYRESLELALVQLRDAAGGRRRQPV
jgi:HemY protein